MNMMASHAQSDFNTGHAAVLGYPISRGPRSSYYGFGHHFVTRPTSAPKVLMPTRLPRPGEFLNLSASLGDQITLWFNVLGAEYEKGTSLLANMKWRVSWDGKELYDQLEDCFERDVQAWKTLGVEPYSMGSDSAASAYLKTLGLAGVCRPTRALSEGERKDERPWRYTLFRA